MSEQPKILTGSLKTDARGSVRFVNDFSFAGVKRFYQVQNATLDEIRAFHGHMEEGKYVYCATGRALLCAVHLTDQEQPSKDEAVQRFMLDANEPQVVYIPPKYANGWRAITPDAIVQFFSTSTLQESLADDYRFPADYWGDAVWETNPEKGER